MTNYLILIILILPALKADDSNVKYTDGGAVITGLGLFELNNPDPLTFEYDNIASCIGEFLICYKSLDPYPASEKVCGQGYQGISVDLQLKLMSGFRHSAVDSKTRFTFEKLSPYAKPPDISDGLFHYRVITLPTGCTIKILGATDPNSTTPATDSLKTAKLIIYILAGAAGAIL
uniref:CUB domain-containing protein n=1 Tax=Panagrellus redivivus TaxID=6233 RepID=A0A7E4VEV1_PANRE